MKSMIFCMGISFLFLNSTFAADEKGINDYKESMNCGIEIKLNSETNHKDYDKMYLSISDHQGQDRISMELYDYNKDGKVDWVRRTDYKYSNNDNGIIPTPTEQNQSSFTEGQSITSK